MSTPNEDEYAVSAPDADAEDEDAELQVNGFNQGVLDPAVLDEDYEPIRGAPDAPEEAGR